MITVKETTASKTRHRDRFPARALGVGVQITFLFVGGDALLAWRSYQDTHAVESYSHDIEGFAVDFSRYA